jgi:hypothetical protein
VFGGIVLLEDPLASKFQPRQRQPDCWLKYPGTGEFEGVRCCNCDGNHVPNSPECPVRVKEYEVARVRAIQQASFTEAREIVGVSGAEDMAVDASLTVEIQCCSTVEGNLYADCEEGGCYGVYCACD